MYEGCASPSVVVRYVVMPHIRHVYVLQPSLRPHVRHARLGLHIEVSFKGKTTCNWSFGCGLTCTTSMECVGFRLLFGTNIVL